MDNISEEQKLWAKETRSPSQFANNLVIQVNKFDSYMQTIRKNVFPEDTLETATGDTFELVAIVNHIGANLYSGHYVTYVKRDNKWFECNDQTCSEVMKDSIISDNNYVYVYQERKIQKHVTTKSKECRKQNETQYQKYSTKNGNTKNRSDSNEILMIPSRNPGFSGSRNRLGVVPGPKKIKQHQN